MKNMKIVFEALGASWYFAPPATDGQIRVAELALSIKLPDDYKQLVLWSNGGEGWIGGRYFSPWPVEELKPMNDGYEIPRCLPGLIGIGCELGPTCYLLDYRESSSEPKFVSVQYGGFEPELVVTIAPSVLLGLEAFLQTERPADEF